MGFGKRKHKGRKPDARPMSAGAEICEARVLLSADGAEAIVGETVNDSGDDAEVVICETGELVFEEGFVPEIAICEMLPVDMEGTEGELIEGEVIEGEESLFEVTTFEEWNPEWAYAFISSVVEHVDGEVFEGEIFESEVIEGEVFEGEVLADGEEHFDITTLEDWDPSWAYRGFVVDGEEFTVTDELVNEEFVEEIAFEVTAFGWEDGLGCGIAEDGFAPEGEELIECVVEEVTIDGEGHDEIVEVTGFVDEEFTDEEFTDEEFIDEEFVGEEIVCEELTDKELEEEYAEITAVEDSGQVIVIERVEAPEWQAEGSLQIRPVFAANFRGGGSSEEPQFSRTGSFEGSFSEVNAVAGPVAEVSTMAAESVQTTVVATSIPAVNVPVVTSQLAVPVIQTSLSTLFADVEDFSAIGTLVSASDELATPVVESELDSLASPLTNSIESLTSALDNEASDTSLELTPLLDADEESESESVRESEPEPFADESETQSSVKAVSPETDQAVAATEAFDSPVVQVRAARVKHSASDIDRFMTDFAMNGFVI